MTKHTDMFRNQIEIGDLVVVPRSIGRSPELDIGIVTGETPKSIKVQCIQYKDSRYDRYSRQHIQERIEPKLEVERIARNPDRCIVITKKQFWDTIHKIFPIQED